MKKKAALGLLLFMLCFCFSNVIQDVPIIGGITTVEAAPTTWKKGSYYWNSSMGRYVVTSYPIYKGSVVNNPGINTILKRAKTAVINKYGKVTSSKYYKFTVVQHVQQAHLTSMKGSVKSVTCNGIY